MPTSSKPVAVWVAWHRKHPCYDMPVSIERLKRHCAVLKVRNRRFVAIDSLPKALRGVVRRVCR